MVRILVTGSREWNDPLTINRALVDYVTHGSTFVMHGGCRGADIIADAAARNLHMHVEACDADWDNHGKAAGPMRNSLMVKRGADVCLAFGPLERDGKRTGTGDCVDKARRAGIKVRHWPKPFEPEAK